MFSGITQTQSQQLFSWGGLLWWRATQSHESPQWTGKNTTYDRQVLLEAAIIMTFYLCSQIPQFSLFHCYQVCRFSIASLRRRGTWIDKDFLWQSNGLSLKIQTCSCCSVSLFPLPPCPPESTLCPSPESNVYIRREGRVNGICRLEIAWLGNVSHIPTCW